VLQYILCIVWVFPSAPTNHALGFTAFTLLSLVGLGLTWVAMYGLHELGQCNYLLAKIVALGLSFTWNFSSRKFFLFRPEPERA
jgi:putative flippase GtrA